MKRDDVLDPAKWRQMLWRGATDLDLDEPEAIAEPVPAPSAGPLVSSAQLDLDVASIEEVWRERDPAARLAQSVALTGKLLTGLRLMALSHRHPRAAVRLVRLLVAAWTTIGQEEGRQRAIALSLARLDHPELGDLLVEVAALGDLSLAFAIELSSGERSDLETLDPHLGQKFARLLEHAATWRSRAFALRWLARGRWPEAVPWWRKALRWHHLRCRCVALRALLERPGALSPDDVAWLVEDAVVHPVPERSSEDSEVAWSYERALLDAIKRAPSAALRAPLERIIAEDAVFMGSDRRWLDRGWAMEALASIDADRAREHADHDARCAEMYRRADAVRVYRVLPAEVARGPLQALAGDVDELVARTAVEAWTARFGAPCPVDELAGVAAHLLDQPPSERFLARLAVFRGKDRDARAALLREVMREPPTREGLVLTLYGRRANPNLYGKGIPSNEGAWVRWLLRRHRRVAYDAVLWEAEDAPGGTGWLFALGLRARDETLPATRRAAVAEAALRALQRDPVEDIWALSAIHYAGPLWEGVERYWSLLLAAPYHIMNNAVEVLAALGPDELLDRRTAAAFATARAEGDWSRVARAGAVGVARRVAPVIAQIEADLWTLDDPSATETLNDLQHRLHRAGLVPDQRVVDALADPAEARFVRYADRPWVRGKALRKALVARLRAALNSTARAGESAALAVVALLHLRAMGAGDRRIDAISARAPGSGQLAIVRARARLLRAKTGRAPLEPGSLPLLERLLGHPDAAVGMECVEHIELSDDVDGQWLGAVYDALPPGKVREGVRYMVGRPSEAECFWSRDDDDDDDDE